MKTFVRFFGSITALVTLYACVSKQPQEPPKFDLTSFTTEGKATKSIVTPQGEFEVYDPAQDTEVLKIFSLLRAKGKNQRDPLTSSDYTPYKAFFEDLHTLQTNDLLRHGCIIENNSLCRMDPNYISNTIPSACPNPDFGSPDLTDCEAKNLQLHPTDPQLDIPLGDSLLTCGNPFPYIGKKKTDLTDSEAARRYFRSSCEYFSGEIIMGTPLEQIQGEQ